MEGRHVSQSEVHMTEMVLPSHTNTFGSVFGGQVVSWIDIAAAISAQRHSGQPVVTASIDDLHFVAPVYQGWIVLLKSCVNYAFKTSMEVGVRVDAENPRTREQFHTASAYLTFVALDDQGCPYPVPPAIADTQEQQRRMEDAQKRRQFRLERRKVFQKC